MFQSSVKMAAENKSPTAAQMKQNLGLWEELDYKTEVFTKLTQTCFNKCVDSNYKEGELYIGENACIDRCVSKYWQVTNIIGQMLASGSMK